MYNDWPYSFTLALIIALGQNRIKIFRGFARKWKESEKEIVTMDICSNKKLAHNRDKIFSNSQIQT